MMQHIIRAQLFTSLKADLDKRILHLEDNIAETFRARLRLNRNPKCPKITSLNQQIFKLFLDVSDENIHDPNGARFYQFAIEGIAQSIVGLLGLIGKV